MVLEDIALRDCPGRFRAWTVEDVTTAAVCQSHPQALARAALTDGRVEGLLIPGAGARGFAPSAWRLHPVTLQAGMALVRDWHLRTGPGSYLTAPWWVRDAAMAELAPPAELSIDLQFMRLAAGTKTGEGVHLVWSEQCVAGRGDARDVQGAGWTRDQPAEWRSAAVVVDGAPVSRACSCVRAAGAAYIHGVETYPAHRRRGYGRAVVTAVANSLLELGLIPVYHCAETHVASAATARASGFELNRRLCVLAK